MLVKLFYCLLAIATASKDVIDINMIDIKEHYEKQVVGTTSLFESLSCNLGRTCPHPRNRFRDFVQQCQVLRVNVRSGITETRTDTKDKEKALSIGVDSIHAGLTLLRIDDNLCKLAMKD
jgi:hypothetical protein